MTYCSDKSIPIDMISLMDAIDADFCKTQEPLIIRDYSNSRGKSYIATESQALAAAEILIPDWEQPVTNQSIGGGNYQGINVAVRKTVAGDVDAVSALYYYQNDLLSSILATAKAAVESVVSGGSLSLREIMESISWVYNASGDYVASINGRFFSYIVDNTRTKIATISGTTYYWAGWDRKNLIYSGDAKSGQKMLRDYKHVDYDQSVSYFVQKAVYNYLNE